MPTPSVSLILATYQRIHCLGETVRQLLEAQTRPPLELIIVNNDPATGAEDEIRAVVGTDPRIRIISCLTGRQGACRNAGLLLAQGAYVAFVDDDDDYDPRYIELLAGALDQGRRSVRCRIRTCGYASPDCSGHPTDAHHPLTPNTMARRDVLTPTWHDPPHEDRDYWRRHPVEATIEPCLVFTCQGPGRHSPRNSQQGGSWRHRVLVSLLVSPGEGQWAVESLTSLVEQRYPRLRILIIDASGDTTTGRSLRGWGDRDSRIRYLAAGGGSATVPFRLGLWWQQEEGLPGKDDLILPLRASTRLASRDTIRRVVGIFDSDPAVWMAFGTSVTEPLMFGWPTAVFSPSIWAARRFRATPDRIGLWAPLVLRAPFTEALLAGLPAEALAGVDPAAPERPETDLALLLCALEAAGQRHAHAHTGVLAIERVPGDAESATARQLREWEAEQVVRARPPVAPFDEEWPEGDPLAAVPGATEPSPPPTTPPPAAAELPVHWMGPVYDPSGYAAEVRDFVLALARAGTRTSLRALANRSPAFRHVLSPVLRDQLDTRLAQPADLRGVTVLHAPPSFLQRIPGARYLVGRTMFETTGLNPAFVANCNQMDELWVPSDFNRDTFRSAGVRVPIHKVPGGIDTERFRPGHVPLEIPGVRDTVFLSTCEWKPRKGWQVLVRAWVEAFSAADPVSLVFRSSIPGTTERDSGPAIRREIEAFLASLGTSADAVAPIIVLGRQLPHDALPSLYAGAHVYVTASSGEGWGYPYMEAMASGLPTIATRWSGNLEFMNDENSLLCEVERLIPAVDPYVGPLPGQQWALPSARHLAALLRIPLDDPERAARIAGRGRDDMRTHWSWERAARRVRERLDELAEALSFAAARHSGTTPAAGLPRDGAPLVRWEGPLFTTSSLGSVNREVCRGLLKDPRLALVMRPTQPHDFLPSPGTPFEEVAHRLEQPATRAAAVHVAHQWPPELIPPSEGAWVVMQPWEYGGLPGGWVPTLREAVDEYWVYCTWQRDCAVASGVPEDKVHVLPLGVDPALFHPDGPRFPLTTTRGTRLLAIGGIIPRKGMDVLVSAYLKAFTATDDVCLVIKGLSAPWAYHGNSGQADFAQLPQLAREGGMPEIEFIGETLDDEHIPSLYRACDVLVAPFRGEGFCLPLVEAMASGLPVICTAAGPALDICTPDTAVLVPSTREPVAADIAGLAPGALGYWWEQPDEAALIEAMRRLVGDPEARRAMGQAGRARAEAHFTARRMSDRMADRLSRLADHPPVRFTPGAEYRPEGPNFPLDETRGTVLLYFPAWHDDTWKQGLGACFRSYSSADDVTLVLAADPVQGVVLEDIQARLLSLQAELGFAATAMPDLLVVPDVLTDAVCSSLMRAATYVLVDPYDVARRAQATATGTDVATPDTLPPPGARPSA